MFHLAPDALHIHVGLFVFLAVALLVRGERRFLTALWVVLAISIAAEALDLSRDLSIGRRLRWFNSLKDIANAVFWPAILAFAGPPIVSLLQSAEVQRATDATGPLPGAAVRREPFSAADPGKGPAPAVLKPGGVGK